MFENLLQSKEALIFLIAGILVAAVVWGSYKWGYNKSKKQEAEAAKKVIMHDLQTVGRVRKRVLDMTEKELDEHL